MHFLEYSTFFSFISSTMNENSLPVLEGHRYIGDRKCFYGSKSSGYRGENDRSLKKKSGIAFALFT